MDFSKTLPIFSACTIILSISLFTLTHAATFDVTNQCAYTVWAAASPGGGGRRLDSGQTWRLSVDLGDVRARIWGRTNCDFNGSGQGACQTGDCNGLLECRGNGQPPLTLAELALNQISNLDFFDISLVDGFNIPMEFSPTTNVCRSIRCTAPINEQCPAELRATGGCNNPCTVFQESRYCCNNGTAGCGPTAYSRFFKKRCPDAYSYPLDDATSTFTCPAGTNYSIVFCPEATITLAQCGLMLSLDD